MKHLLFSLSILLFACGDDVSISPDAMPDAMPDAALSANGSACALDSECASGICVTALGGGYYPLPDGLCTTLCDAFTNTGCAVGEDCLIFSATGEQYCFQSCSDGTACRPGWHCEVFDPLTASCIPNR